MKRTIVSILGLILLSSTAVFAQSSYLIKPGDKIVGKVMGENGFNFEAIIDDNGSFELPFVNETVNAQCRTAKAVQKDVIKHYSKYLREPMISVKVTDKRPNPPITVSGEVLNPASIELKTNRKVRLLELITFSGGAKPDSAGGEVRVFRTQKPVCLSDDEKKKWQTELDKGMAFRSQVYSLREINTAKTEYNPIIYPGDIVLVEKAAPVYFTGEVVSRQGLYIPEGGLSLSQAIAMLGGTQKKAKTKDIKIYRKKGNDDLDREIISVNYELIRKGEAKDVWLKPYDVVNVEEKKKSKLKTFVEIVSGVGRNIITSASTTGTTRVLY